MYFQPKSIFKKDEENDRATNKDDDLVSVLHLGKDSFKETFRDLGDEEENNNNGLQTNTDSNTQDTRKDENPQHKNKIINELEVVAAAEQKIEKKEQKQEEEKKDEPREDELVITQLADDTSNMPVEVFDERYPRCHKNKVIKLPAFAVNHDLLKALQVMPDVESLDISNCNLIYDFSPITKMQYLKQFAGHNCQMMKDIQFLNNCRDLEVLNVSGSPISDISNLGNFTKLKLVNFTGTKITSLRGIEKCQDLLELSIWGCIGIRDLTPISTAYKLRTLDMDYTSVDDLYPLINLKQLEFLFMDNCDMLKDYTGLGALTGLKSLFADGKNMLPVSQLENITELKNLVIVTMKNRKILSAEPFSVLHNLQELVLEGNALSSVEPLKDLVKLNKFDITANSTVKDVSCLSRLTKLKKFLIGGGGDAKSLKNTKLGAGVSACSQMEISDVSVISNFTNLVEFNITNNPKVRTIEGIKNCQVLEECYLNKCTQLEEISELGYIKTLQKLHLNYCPKIKDLYFLQYLPNMLELQFDGTIVNSVAFLSNFKKSNNMYLLKGYGSDLLSVNVIGSAKKKNKMQKSLRKYFAAKKD